MLRAFWVLVAVLFAAPVSAQEYQSKDLADAAAQYRQELIESIPAAKKQPALIARLRRDADAEYRAKRYRQAIDDLGQAIAHGADDGLVWLRLAQAKSLGNTRSRQRLLQEAHELVSIYATVVQKLKAKIREVKQKDVCS